jgi:hypothetical protein
MAGLVEAQCLNTSRPRAQRARLLLGECFCWCYAAGGACPSRSGIRSSMHAQLGACETQIVVAGLAISRSSRVPLRTNTRCGRASAALNTCVPQVGQKLRCITLPLSATLRKSRSSPLTTIASLAKHVFTVALPAPMYWHTRHQHTRVTIGAALIR